MSVVGKCFLKGKVLNEREIERVIAQRATWGLLKDGGGESEGCWGNNSKRVVLSIESAIARRKPRRNLDLGDEGQRRDGECDLKSGRCVYIENLIARRAERGCPFASGGVHKFGRSEACTKNSKCR